MADYCEMCEYRNCSVAHIPCIKCSAGNYFRQAEANATPETKQLVDSRQDVSGLVKQLSEKMGE